MSVDIMPFCFESNEVRAVMIQDEPWFVARDICWVLSLKNVTEALRGLDEDERKQLDTNIINSEVGGRGTLVVNESGLYSLVFKSRKAAAKRFRKWVTSEVLPTIRKTGSYDLKEKKVVDVNHVHTRSTAAPNGLDIKYNLDLTKVISRPTREGLEILERLTGITFTDIRLGSDGVDDLFQKFIGECCDVAEGERVSSFVLYGAWRRWLSSGCGRNDVGIQVFNRLASAHFTKIKSSRMYYQGLKLKELED